MISAILLVVCLAQVAEPAPGSSLDHHQINKVFDREINYESIVAPRLDPPSSVGDFISELPIEVNALAHEEFLPNVPIYVDEPMLVRNGIDLDDTTSWGFYILARRVSLRSSLRFILDSYGVSYYIGEQQVVIPTKANARAVWLSQLKRPEPNMLNSGTLDERRATAFAAGYWSIDPDKWLGPLIHSVLDTDRQIAFDAAFALGELGPLAEAAIGPLVDNLHSTDPAIREASVNALAKIGPRAIDGLLKLVDDPDSATATAAVRSLGMMGHAGKDAVPRLLEIGNRSNSVVLRSWISNALVSLDPLGSLSGIRDRMKDERPNVRLFAVETISDVARLRLDRLSVPKPDEVVDDLFGLRGDPDTDVRRAASFALCKIDLPVDTPLAPLEGAIRDSDDEVREHASFALRLLKSAQARAAAESTQIQRQP